MGSFRPDFWHRQTTGWAEQTRWPPPDTHARVDTPGPTLWFVAVEHRPWLAGRADVLGVQGRGEAEMHREQFSEEVLIEGRGIFTL